MSTATVFAQCAVRGETCADQMHRIRRGAMNPMFSRKIVTDLELVVQDEAYSILMAAADTTGNAMTVAAFWVRHCWDWRWVGQALPKRATHRYANYRI